MICDSGVRPAILAGLGGRGERRPGLVPAVAEQGAAQGNHGLCALATPVHARLLYMAFPFPSYAYRVTPLLSLSAFTYQVRDCPIRTPKRNRDH